jgi:3-methyladenine DNA glycosylase AlkD
VNYEEVVQVLRARANPATVVGMARFGINTSNAIGISVPFLRQLAKQIGRDHALAHQLWDSGIHEARILAAFIDVPSLVTEEQMELWASDFDSWDVCDQVCGNLFDRTPHAYIKAIEWAGREEEFVRRAGFVLMASLAVHDKKAADERFLEFLLVIDKHAHDPRNFVKKAVNWALRQIGKRNSILKAAAIACAGELAASSNLTRRWVGTNALRDFKRVRRR